MKRTSKNTAAKTPGVELIAPRGDRWYDRRAGPGGIKKSDDVSRSVSSARDREAKNATRSSPKSSAGNQTRAKR